MARQLQALGRALYGMRAATPEFARVGAPLGFVSTRAFSSAVEGPPANDAAAPARADLRETVERRLSADASRQSAPEDAAPAGPAPGAAPARPKLNVVKRSEMPSEPEPSRGFAGGRGSSGGQVQEGPAEPPRLHPLRLFYPGQTYKPEELDGDAADAASFVHLPSQKTRQLHKRGEAANAELYDTADFRNGRLLNQFVSEAGKLLPRRTNKVDAKVQRKLVRAVKTARMMAILPYTERLPSFAKGRKNPYS